MHVITETNNDIPANEVSMEEAVNKVFNYQGETKLKSCPFCGISEFEVSAMLVVDDNRVRLYYHKQNGCVLSGVQFKDYEWNNRVDTSKDLGN